MASYISDWNGVYPNSTGNNTATGITNMIGVANDWYNYSTIGVSSFYELTSTLASGYFYDGTNFTMSGSGFYSNLFTVNFLGITTTSGWVYSYSGSIKYNVITDVQTGFLGEIAIISPTDEMLIFRGKADVNSTIASITEISNYYTDGHWTIKGALSYNDVSGVITGNVSSYKFTDNFNHSYTVSGFSIPFAQLNAYTDLDSFVSSVMAGNDVINGTVNDEVLRGFAGNDTLDGAAGADTLQGGQGNDTYIIDNAGDVVTELLEEGTDLVKVKIATANGTYTLTDNVENGNLINTVAFNLTGNTLDNILIGNAAANTLVGDAGNDTLDGGAGIDTLNGGEGDDKLIGGAGKDALTGGNGADTFIFNSALSATTNVDSIADFVSGLDHLQLNSTIFTKLKGDIDLSDNFYQIGVSTQDANDYIVYNSATGALYYDSNGSVAGGSTQFTTLVGVAPLASSDFVIAA